MEKETEKERETTIYNLRSRVVHTRCSTVSKAQEEETSKGKKPEDDDDEMEEDSDYGLNLGPPPLTGRRLQNHLKKMNRILREHAIRALFSYNKGRQELQLPRYRLVETLGMEACALKCGSVYHLNFKARPKDDPGAPPELFFAERVISWRGLKETRCYNMGTESPEPATVGRKACTLCLQIYHPKGKEFVGSVVG